MKIKDIFQMKLFLIIDGPVKQSLLNNIKKWNEVLPIKIFKLNKNMGLAYALNYGMSFCNHDWVFWDGYRRCMCQG